MTILTSLFLKKPKVQCVAAHLYEDQILLISEDKVKDGYWIYSDYSEVLSNSVDNNVLGDKIRHIAKYSKVGVRNPNTKEDFNEIGKKLLHIGNFKTQKSITTMQVLQY